MEIIIDSKKENGDATTFYTAHFDVNPTLGEFIQWLIKEKNQGAIETKGFRRVGYVSNGNWEWDEYRQDESRRISLLWMNGGWGMMTYCIDFL